VARQPSPRIWALLGLHRGDNNQVIALAEALGIPFELKMLRYNGWRRLKPRFLGASLLSVASESRSSIAGDPPDLIISTGHRSVPVVQALRRRSMGRTRCVHIGFPRLPPERFDLVITTPEYPIPDHPNVMRIPFALTRDIGEVPMSRLDASLLERFPIPRRLLVLGGPTRYWRLETNDVLDALSTLLDVAEREGGSVLAVGSPRTPAEILRAVEPELKAASVPAILAPIDGPPAYSNLLRVADSIFVTADSVAMVGDAITTGRPVGLVPIRATRNGARYMKLMNWIRPGQRVHPRDLRFFWAALERNGLVGTVQHPRNGVSSDLAAEVVERVLKLLQ
jgi:mitochondrial fission protein ELM1